MTSSHDQLERDLRAALRSIEHVPVSGDAWQQNQQRLRESGSRRGRRLLAVAAGVLVVLLVGGLIAVATNGPDSGTPANGGRDDGTSDSMSSDDMFADENLLGPIVELETLQVGGETAVHEGALSDTSGKGPSLCDRVVARSSESGGCTSRDPAADKYAVAFDWLAGTMGSGDIRGVLAGVDERVQKVQIWMTNGDMVLADLKPAGWEGTKVFALTLPADGPRPQRLVAYAGGNGPPVLQAVDLTATLGDDWLPARQSCDGPEQARWPTPDARDHEEVIVSFGHTDALVTDSHGSTPVCLDRLSPRAIAGWSRFGDLVVAVVAPEVQSYRVEQAPPGLQTDWSTVTGSPWQVLVARVPAQSTFGDAQLVVLDRSGRELAREYLHQPVSP